MKHAYLIIAHNEFDVLKLLISMIDDERNDIYVHIDKKVRNLPELSASKSRLYILDKRVDVRWGHVSQIETELLLFETAHGNGPYSYYHMISGTHLPLKDQDYLHSFYDSVNGQEIMRVWPKDEGDAEFKLRRYHFFRSREMGQMICLNSFFHFLWVVSLKIQKSFGLKRRRNDHFVKTDNWMSLTNQAVEYLLENKQRIIHEYSFSFCGDEYFAASELYAAGGMFSVRDTPNLLFVEFDKANAKVLRLNEYQRLLSTEYLFARKFVN